jgi:predicted DsbA family dithiol-disulfide isomerase
MSLRTMLAICISVLTLALGCPPQQATEPDESDVGDATTAAILDGETFTVAEIDAWIMEQLFDKETNKRNATKLFEIRSEYLQALINERLLEKEAAARGLAPEELVRQETEKRTTISDEDLLAVYEENKERLGERTFEEMKPQIYTYLQRTGEQTAAREYLESLRENASIEIHLEAPRVDIAARGPSLGPDDAPVTIVEFSDYRCGYCRKAESTVQQLLERYPSEVRLVSRQFPLNPTSRGAAEAAACANEQGRFWEFHRKLFASGGKVDAESLQQYAGEVELNLEAFQVCVDERRFEAEIDADLGEGREAGVTGTPAFFVNGIAVKGARPLEHFVGIIESELRKGEG